MTTKPARDEIEQAHERGYRACARSIVGQLLPEITNGRTAEHIAIELNDTRLQLRFLFDELDLEWSDTLYTADLVRQLGKHIGE